MRTRVGVLGGSLLACVVAIVTTARPAAAQNEPPYDPAIELQLFDYAAGPKTFMSVHDASIVGPQQFVADFFLTFLTDPFTVYDVDENNDEIMGERTRVVESMLTGQVSGAYGITDQIHLGASLPIVFSMSGEGLNPVDAMPSSDGLQATGLGDLLVEAKSPLWENESIRIAGLGGITLPTSFGAGTNDFLGDDLPTVRARAAATWTNPTGKIRAGANLGVVFRKPREIYSSTVGQQLTYGLGGAFAANPRIDVIGEMFGRTGIANMDVDASPLEAVGGVRVLATPRINVLAGGGAGLIQGIGSPGLRVFVSVGYAPNFEDDDGDGIPNLRDQCPLQAEDMDGFEDTDGCPDNDNDGDLRPDDVDECPNEKEDIDGFEDDDGCPDPDNDGDGFPDTEDRCPVDAEDGMEPWPEDGCPGSKRDTDADGIMDDADQCLEEPEDMDGFEDWDGCPDADNDGDGIPDADDQCPVCKEDLDGDADDDGCPDIELANDVAHMENDRLILDEDIPFRRNQLRAAGREVLDQVAALVLEQPDVTKWMLVVADRRSKERAQARAERIKEHLVEQGVPDERIMVLAAVSNNPTTGMVARERQSTDGPTCPAEFKVEPRAEPAEGAAAPAAPAAPADAPETDGDTELDTPAEGEATEGDAAETEGDAAEMDE